MPDRDARQDIENSLKKELIEKLKDKFSSDDINTAFDLHMKALMRKSILEKSPPHGWPWLYWISVPFPVKLVFLPRTHGSGLFNRGETQVMTIATLGS